MLVVAHGFPIGGGRARLDLIATDTSELIQVAEAAGFSLIGPKWALLVTGIDRVGAAADHLKKLADQT